MSNYESLRQRHGLRLLELMPDLIARMSWPAGDLQRLRESRLQALVAQAQAHSPWHRRRLAGLDAARLTEKDLRTLPVMSKTDLMHHFDEIVTDPRLTRDVVESHLSSLTTDAYLLDTYHACASGGSSGRRGAFVFDIDGWATVFGSFIRFNLKLQQQALGPNFAPRTAAAIAADKASHMTAALGQTFPPPAQSLERFPATWPLERIVASLNALQPETLMGYASMLHLLAKEAEAGRLRIAPKMLSSTSEPLLPETRAALAESWGAPVFNGFGSTEGLMGGSCTAEDGIHLSSDLCIIEPVDLAGNPVPPGQRAAKIYLTNLFNFTQPLIRYELTDEVTVLDGPCPCGTTLLRIADIQGRLDDAFRYPSGPTVHPFTFRSILGQDRKVVEYQVHQTPRGADIRVCAQAPFETTHLVAKLKAALRDLGLVEAEVSITLVEKLERQAVGKLRRFVPLPS